MPKALWPAGAAQHAKATVASVATAPLTTPGHAAHDHMPAHEPRLVSCQFKGHARPPHARTRVRHALTGRAPVCAEMRAAARCGAAGCSADSPASASASGAATAASAARAPLAGGPRAALSPRAAAGLGLVVGLRAPAACAGAGRTGDTRRTRRAPARFPVSDPALARWSQVGAAGAGSAQGAPLPAAVAAAAAAWFCLPPSAATGAPARPPGVTLPTDSPVPSGMSGGPDCTAAPAPGSPAVHRGRGVSWSGCSSAAGLAPAAAGRGAEAASTPASAALAAVAADAAGGGASASLLPAPALRMALASAWAPAGAGGAAERAAGSTMARLAASAGAV